MATKYRIACKVASEGIAVIIANGKRDDILLDLMDKKSAVPHTLFHAAATPTSSVKKWIAHSEDLPKGASLSTREQPRRCLRLHVQVFFR